MTSIVRLSGGLGNQLFQLAFARSKTLLNSEVALLDISESSASQDRPVLPWIEEPSDYYQIARLNQSKSTKHFRYWPWTQFNSRKQKNIRLTFDDTSSQTLPIFQEEYRQFVYEFVLANKGYFSGTFASFLYWNTNDRQSLLDWTYFKISEFVNFVPSNNSFGIGIHARRGDYVTNSKTRAFHGFCGLDYFTKAIALLSDLGYADDGILISSDDIQFARALYQRARNFSRNVEIASPDNPFLALIELSACRASIGSNSTFSFWASYLRPKEQRIFPSNWFAQSKYCFDTSAILFDEYQLLDNSLQT